MFHDQRFAAFLFDMDGTVINSIAATERAWGDWARGHGLDVDRFLPTIHGIRAIDTIRSLNLPGADPLEEAAKIERAELTDMTGVVAIPGAPEFLSSLPRHRWGIVTSAPRELALLRLGAAGIPLPDVIVTAENVTNGKPAPDCYELGARRLGFAAADCLVFEDAPAGIAAGEAAGSRVMVITAVHAYPTHHPSMPDYTGVLAEDDRHGLALLTKKQPVAGYER
ncbi:MAG: HAD-IA family hydrolase [Geminicoccaceae bacterium]